MRLTHSRVYYELMLERSKDPAKLEEARCALAQLDGIKPERGSTEIRPTAAAPVLDASWLSQWLDRALPWASVHSNFNNGREHWRVRLLMGAPLEDLANETRLRLTKGNSRNDVNVVFPSKAHREFAIAYIDARKERAAA